jgi:hypothetical protein
VYHESARANTRRTYVRIVHILKGVCGSIHILHIHDTPFNGSELGSAEGVLYVVTMHNFFFASVNTFNIIFVHILYLSFLNAQPLITDGVVLFVGHLVEGFLASLATAVSVDFLVGGLVDNVITDGSHI